MSRKAQGLPLNTVILAILVVLVLFVVGAFFLGGTSGVSKQIRSIFYQNQEGQDRVFAVQTCNQRCDSLKLLPASAYEKSPYCNSFFLIDSNNDGEADCNSLNGICPKEGKVYKKFYCYTQNVEGTTGSLDAPCTLPNGEGPKEFCASDYKPKPA